MRTAGLQARNILLVFILLNLIVGVFIIQDFGIYVDQLSDLKRGGYAIRAYKSVFTGSEFPDYKLLNQGRYIGSAYSSINVLVSRSIQRYTALNLEQSMNYVNFTLFQLGVFTLFYLARRFFDQWVALAVALLYGTQPLLFGHAFFNYKDNALLTLFIIIVTTGLYAADKYQKPEKSQMNFLIGKLRQETREDWAAITRNDKVWLIIPNGLLLILWFFAQPIKNGLSTIVTRAYDAPPEALLGKLFRLIASQSANIPLQPYLTKLDLLYDKLLLYGLALFVVIELALWLFPKTFAALLKLLLNLDRDNYKSILLDPRLITAAVLWGVGIATRSVAIVAGGMVGLYFLLKARKNALFPMIYYSAIGVITTYLFWPFLWRASFADLKKSLLILADHPHETVNMFEGIVYPSYNLPRSFLPVLMSIQFTEPLVVLSVIGLVLCIVLFIRKKTDRLQLFVVASWFLLPFLYYLITTPSDYNNFRHYLFITPPLFIFTGYSIQQIFKLIHAKVVQIALVILILIPGIMPITKLHPYQYIYYNQFVGGVEGAFRRFDLDYFGISYKEAMDFLETVADEDDHVGGQTIILFYRPGSRPYQVIPEYEIEEGRRQYSELDFAIVSTRSNQDLQKYSEGETIFQVVRDNAVLLEVRDLR